MEYLSSEFLQSFVNFVKSTLISGYEDDGNKERFKKESMMILKEIANRMGLIKGSYQVRFNAGGIACSGDPILHGESIYCNMSQFMDTFYYRKCSSIKDYTGFQNHNMHWSKLVDLNYVANCFKETAFGIDNRRY